MIMLDDHENAHKYALPLLVVGLDYVLCASDRHTDMWHSSW